MRILLATDAWEPQVNGVVTTLKRTLDECRALGHDFEIIQYNEFKTVSWPDYKEVKLALGCYEEVRERILMYEPEAVHIATEGPVGLAARRVCVEWGLPFTTSYHTKFPEYVSARLPLPESMLYGIVRRFHNAGNVCMVATQSLEHELAGRGFRNLVRWTRGIDHTLYAPRPLEEKPFGLPRPIFMQVGRVAVEKNIPAFLDLDLPGSKVVIGEGPDLEKLKRAYRDVLFTGAKFGQELAEAYAQADVFVFPSKTDTFGNVILEALASGVPVAAYPVMGPVDILGGYPEAGALDNDLRIACVKALGASRTGARALAESYSWEAATRQFLQNVMQANGMALAAE